MPAAHRHLVEGSEVRSLQDRLKGCWTSLPTPFANDGIDEAAFGRLVEWQVREGACCLVVAGEVGEGSTLSDVDHDPALGRLSRLRSRVPSSFMILAGDDHSGPLHRIMGGNGWLSAAAPVLPGHMREFDCACVPGRWRYAQQRLLALQPLFDALALEPQPALARLTSPQPSTSRP